MERDEVSVGRIYEKFVLQPLQLAYWAVAAYYLLHQAWVIGAALILLSFVVAMIGAKLPHHKNRTAREIEEERASGHATVVRTQPTTQYEADRGDGVAIFATAILLVITAVILLWHAGFKWYLILLGALGMWILALIAFFGVVAMYGLVTRKFKPSNPTSRGQAS